MASMHTDIRFGAFGNFRLAGKVCRLTLLLAGLACSSGAQSAPAKASAPPPAADFRLTSTELQNEGFIPQRFTCDGVNVSPLLSWTHPPAGVQSFALILDDPDAHSRTFVHWLIYNLPAEMSGLPENVPITAPVLESGAMQGENDFHHIGYNGPCPPRGKFHRYIFHLYALDTELAIKPGVRRDVLDRMMSGHILATAELMGRYQRP